MLSGADRPSEGLLTAYLVGTQSRRFTLDSCKHGAEEEKEEGLGGCVVLAVGIRPKGGFSLDKRTNKEMERKVISH